MRQPRERSRLGYRIFYGIALFAILIVWVYAFKSYFEHYDSIHPEIAWAVPWMEVDSVTAKGIFLWNETRLASPRDGSVRFPMGSGPVRVFKGAVVVRVSSGPSVSEVRSPVEGYFIAGLDGVEGEWRYSKLWPGAKELPEVGSVRMKREGASVRKGEAVGKIVPQPQNLRFMGYADLGGNLESELAANRLMVKLDATDTPSQAYVRVYERMGHRVKLYLNMPWFPPDVLLSRNYNLTIEAGETTGVAIPESAVTLRNGREGAYVLTGSNAVFRSVRGRPISGSRFLVTEGIRLGDAVIVNGQLAREGRIKLW